MFPSKEMMVMANPTSLFTAYASIAGSVMLFRSIANELVPRPIRGYLLSALDHLIFKRKTPDLLTLIVEDSSSRSMGANQVYEAAEMYLCTKISPSTTGRLKICKTYKEKNLTIKLAGGEHFVEQFEGIEVTWAFVCPREDKNQDPNGHPQSRNSFFELSFHKEHKDQVLDTYLPFVLEKAKSIKDKERVLKMYTLNPDVYVHGSMWESVNLEHPSTFHTLAMEAEQKKTVMEDLDMFLRRKEFYKRVGRAWKRGYLLYGPPGTGKSSLVAAMANYLKFDVYDLQLGNVKRDSDLRRLLLATGNRSILVIEDIDCSVDLPDRVLNPAAGKSKKSGDGPNQGDKQLTLSGLLNFIDGLWSSCGDERIIVFTTNHKDRLDPALLRPGRMDMHIHMSYCSSDGFRLLASNYLGMSCSSSISTGGHVFEEIEHLMDSRETEVTPAQVAEEMMKSENPDIALEGLVKLLRRKRKKSEGNEIAFYDGNKNGAAAKSKRPKAEADESPTKSSSGQKKNTKDPDIALEGLVKLLRSKRKKSEGNEIAIYDGNKNGAAAKSKRPKAEADESPTKSSSGRKKNTKRCC